MNYRYLTILFMMALFIVTPVAVSAQELIPTPIVTATESSEFIFERESLRPEINRLKVTYRGQIEDYRNKEKQYQISKEDYRQLNTLRSLEEAVRATREAIVARTDVLLTYSELIRLELEESEGIELQRKQNAISQIEAEIRYLREYKEEALAVTTKEEVLALPAGFTLHTPQLQSSVYYSLSLIAIGRLQAVHDKSRIIKSDIEKQLSTEESSSVIRSQRERALNETDTSLSTVNDILNRELVELKPVTNRSMYTRVKQNLGQVYSGLAQSTEYLKELLEL